MAGPPASYGYPKSPISADVLPFWEHPISRFAVDGPDDWRVSKLASLDRGIRIENGTGRGDAVVDVTGGKEGDDAYETLSLPKPSIPSQWFLIVRRRNWFGTGTSTLVAIPGTAKKEIPGVGSGPNQRRNVPGTEADQPLALCLVTQKDAIVQEVIDLRVLASNGGLVAMDDLVKQFLDTPGAAVLIRDTLWRYQLVGNNVWDWKPWYPGDALSPKVRCGYGVVVTDRNGFCTIGYSQGPFPGQTINAVANSMDPPGGFVAFEFVMGEPHAASFRAFASTGEPLPNARVGISYFAGGY